MKGPFVAFKEKVAFANIWLFGDTFSKGLLEKREVKIVTFRGGYDFITCCKGIIYLTPLDCHNNCCCHHDNLKF